MGGTRFDEAYKSFQKTSNTIRAQKHTIASLSPEDLHSKLVREGEFRTTVDNSMRTRLKDYKIQADLKVSDKEFLKNNFVRTAHDRGSDGKTHAASVNEFAARIFILQVMLGQTIARAKEIAMKVYDETIGCVMSQLADIFCLSLAELTEEIEGYVNEEDYEERVDNGEPVTYGFVQRKHFCDMYVGVMASIAVPLLCATVLPLLMEGRHISTDAHKTAVEEAKKDLSSMARAKGPCCLF